MDFFDDGPEKPVRIWSRIGRRPILAAATRTATCRCCGSPTARPTRLRILSSTTTPTASSTTRRAPRTRSRGRRGWTVISIKDDWTTVFGS